MPAHNHPDRDVFHEDCFVCRWYRDHRDEEYEEDDEADGPSGS